MNVNVYLHEGESEDCTKGERMRAVVFAWKWRSWVYAEQHSESESEDCTNDEGREQLYLHEGEDVLYMMRSKVKVKVRIGEMLKAESL